MQSKVTKTKQNIKKGGCIGNSLPSLANISRTILLYPMQRVAKGIMFLTRPSVSQSVSPVFLASVTPLKPLNRIS